MGRYVVTGSASGLGAACARRLDADGHEVIGLDLHDADIIADLSTESGRARGAADIADASGGSLDGFVACAGVGPELPTDLIVAVNYFGAVDLLEAALPLLAAGDPGAAVAFCSNSVGLAAIDDPAPVAAMLADDEPGAVEALAGQIGPVVYAMSKVGLATWLRTNVNEWGSAGVRLNAVAPGPIETPLLAASRADATFGQFVDMLPIPLGRTGQPDEIAGTVAFLLGPDASYVHGSIVFCDAGIDAETRPTHI